MLIDTDEKKKKVLKVLQSLLILHDTGKQLNQPPPMNNFEVKAKSTFFSVLLN